MAGCRAHPHNEQHQQQSPAAAAGSSHQQAQQLPSLPKVAEQLYNIGLIDVPKMLDIAVLYGPGNSELTGRLLQQLLDMQPRYAQVRGVSHRFKHAAVHI